MIDSQRRLKISTAETTYVLTPLVRCYLEYSQFYRFHLSTVKTLLESTTYSCFHPTYIKYSMEFGNHSTTVHRRKVFSSLTTEPLTKTCSISKKQHQSNTSISLQAKFHQAGSTFFPTCSQHSQVPTSMNGCLLHGSESHSQ